ncbi:unnamed protein product [Parajaminaea phylloscopi]
MRDPGLSWYSNGGRGALNGEEKTELCTPACQTAGSSVPAPCDTACSDLSHSEERAGAWADRRADDTSAV